MSQRLNSAIAVIGADIGKNSFHIFGHDETGAIVLRRTAQEPIVDVPWSNGFSCSPPLPAAPTRPSASGGPDCHLRQVLFRPPLTSAFDELGAPLVLLGHLREAALPQLVRAGPVPLRRGLGIILARFLGLVSG